MTTKTLADVFRAHGTDKHLHGYHAFYETLQPPARMLEVGVFRGASLRAWREWWPEAFIHGMDTGKRVSPDPSAFDTRTMFWMGDSRNLWLPIEYRGRFDLIIDDGSHKPRDQAATFRNLYPLLAPGGVYAIEDVVLYDRPLPAWFQERSLVFNATHLYVLLDAIDQEGGCLETHDYRDQSGKPDSVLLVVRKP